MKTILLILAVMVSMWVYGQPCTLQLSGTVSDLDTKQPLDRATLLIKELNQSVVTDDHGIYRFSQVCPGTWTIVVSHVNCMSIEWKIRIENHLVRNFVMPHNYNQLQEIILQGPLDLLPNSIKSEISRTDLRQTRGLTLGETLRKITGVTVLQTGSTVFKPVIHGLHSQRVLILNNGVRLEGQQWGAEHAPELDPFIADRLIVLKGAGALRYGADAIGGAILVEPKALPQQQTFGGEVNTVFFSNNRMGVFNAMIEQNMKRFPQWSWRLQGTYKRGGNSRTPDYWLYNTGVEELNGSINIGYKKKKVQADLFMSVFNTKIGIFWGSHVGNLTDLETAIRAPKPVLNIDSFSYQISRPRQEVSHYLVKAKWVVETKTSAKFQFLFAHQENFRKEFDRALITNRPELNLNLGTSTLDCSYERNKRNGLSGVTGFMIQRQGHVWDGSRFFIPNFNSWMSGLYAIERWKLQQSVFEVGIRYDYRTQRVFRNQNNVITSVQRSFNNLSGSLAYIRALHKSLKWVTNFSLSWRPPSVNELYVNGLHHGTANFEIGNPELNSEVGYNFTSQLKYEKDSSFHIDVSVYSNYIHGFINLVPALPPTLTLRGAYPTFRYIQTNAWLTGLDLSMEKELSRAFHWSAKASFLLPRDVKAQTWLLQMPAQRVTTDFTWYFRSGHPRQTFATVNLLWVGRQTFVPKGSLDYLPPPDGYFLTNLEYATLLHIKEKHLNFAVSIYNVLNTRYRDYMNRFRYFNDETGRNIVVRLKIPF